MSSGMITMLGGGVNRIACAPAHTGKQNNEADYYKPA